MDPKLIARLDRHLGKPLCALLSACERVRRVFSDRASEPPRRVVFVKLIEMGSTVLACPAFAEAERALGRGNLFLLAFASNRGIADVLPYFAPDHVIGVDDRGPLRFALGLLRALARLRRERVDTAIDMEGLSSASAIITWLTGARRRIGLYNFTAHGPYRGRLFTHELNYTFQHHVAKTFVALVRAALEQRDEKPLLKQAIDDGALRLPRFEPSAEELEQVRGLLRARARSPVERIILLNPNCSDLLPLRRWPTESFVELGKLLLAALPDVTIVVTGAPSEQREATRIALAMDSERTVSVAGHTTLRQLLALYTLSELLISNDSGPVHFAGLTPIRVLALFGPETPALYGPLGPRARALSKQLACSPCVNLLNHRVSPCTDNQCMQRIGVEEVFAAARELLAS